MNRYKKRCAHILKKCRVKQFFVKSHNASATFVLHFWNPNFVPEIWRSHFKTRYVSRQSEARLVSVCFQGMFLKHATGLRSVVVFFLFQVIYITNICLGNTCRTIIWKHFAANRRTTLSWRAVTGLALSTKTPLCCTEPFKLRIHLITGTASLPIWFFANVWFIGLGYHASSYMSSRGGLKEKRLIIQAGTTKQQKWRCRFKTWMYERERTVCLNKRVVSYLAPHGFSSECHTKQSLRSILGETTHRTAACFFP